MARTRLFWYMGRRQLSRARNTDFQVGGQYVQGPSPRARGVLFRQCASAIAQPGARAQKRKEKTELRVDETERRGIEDQEVHMDSNG